MANIIFDFDGTMADTLGITIEIFEGLRHRKLSRQEVERLRGMSLRRVGVELRIVPWKIPYLLSRGRAQMRRRIGEVDIFDGMKDLVQQLHADGHQLYMVSSNSVRNIRLFLKRQELYTAFTQLLGGAGVFGKKRQLKRFVRRRQLNLDKTFYIGDEVRDIEAAHHAGIKVISVTWGYNTEQVLRDHRPDFVVRSPAEVLRIIEP